MIINFDKSNYAPFSFLFSSLSLSTHTQSIHAYNSNYYSLYIRPLLHIPTKTCRHGVLLPRELDSLPDLLNRLGRVHSLFSQPHPLTKTAGHHREAPTPTEGAIISVEAFHRSFLKYLMENRFCSLMYHYLDCYG